MLLVHAHPDDEVTGTGVTIARAVDSGAQVTLVTCTLGEEGEIAGEHLAHLSAAQLDELGKHRIEELTAAMQALGVTDFVRLGHDGKYRDSGMDRDPAGKVIPTATINPSSFWAADLREAATDLVPIIRGRRPEVLVTYDDFGGYGHPDHIQAHRVAMYAAQLAAVPSYRTDLGDPWGVPRILWTAQNGDWMLEQVRRMRAEGDTETFPWIDPDKPLPPSMTRAEDIAVTIRAPELIDRKMDAFRAHASQIPADSFFFTVFERWGAEAWCNEFFRYVSGVPLPPGATDIFEGL